MGILTKLFGDKSNKSKSADKKAPTQENEKITTIDTAPAQPPKVKKTQQPPVDMDAKLAEIADINDINTLKSLVKQYKGKKKKLYRAAKDRLERMKTRQQRIDELQTQFDTLGQSAIAQSLSLSAVLSAEKQLNTLAEEIPADILHRHTISLTDLKNVAKSIEDAKNVRQNVLLTLNQAYEALKNGEFDGNRKAFNAQMNEQQQAWLSTPEWQSAEAKGMGIRFEQLLSQANNAASVYFDEKQHRNAQDKILSQCQRWLTKNTFVTADMLTDQEKRWQSLSPLTEPTEQKTVQSEFDSLISQLREKSNQQIAAQNDNDVLVPQLVEDFAIALEEGKIKKAQKLQTQVRDRLKSDAGLSKSVHKNVSGRFKRLEHRLTELKKWQHFGDDHVRQDLIEGMQKLIDDDSLDILDKADQVKALQEQWKNLKGHAPSAMWEQFKQLGDQAWEPCAAHFKAERNQSKDLLKARLQFLEEAQQHLDAIDWTNPNWKALGEAHRKFEKMWREFPKLQEKEFRKAKKAHDTLVKQWDKHLDEERKREKVRRENLIKQAEAQLDAEDTLAATSVIKDLQSQWAPTLGLKKRSAEQALWERFKNACDSVFAEHHKLRNESREAINSAFDGHQAQIDDIAQLLTQNGDFTTLQKQFSEAMQALPDFDDMPEKAQRALRAQVNNLTATFDKQQHEALLDKRLDYLAQLNDQDLLCIQIERDLLNPERLESLSTKWHSIEPLLSDGQSSMRKRFEQALQAQSDSALVKDDAAVVAEAQKICLSLEMTADLPSPDFAQSAREQLRLKILDDAMNGDKSFERYTTEAGLYDITVRWRTLPKGALNVASSGDSLINWRARFDESVKQIRTNNQLKQETINQTEEQ